MTRTISRAGMALALAMLAGCQSAPVAGEPAGISWTDSRNLPAAALQDRLIGQLDALLVPMPAPPRWQRFANRADQFSDLWMGTRPRVTEGGGMCTYDLLRVQVRPDGPWDDSFTKDTPTHAYGVESTAWFAPLPAGAKDCAGADPATTHYFETDKWLDAERDYAMLKDVLARLRSAAPGFAISCDPDVKCTEVPYRSKAETLWDIRECRGVALSAGQDCRHFAWREPEYVEMNVIFGQPALERKVVTVNFEPSIVVD